MNQNQLAKLIKRAGDAYANADNYIDILMKRTPCIRVSLKHIQNTQAILDSWNEAMDKAISLPWASILFDIRDYEMPNYMTGQVEAQNMGIHVQALSIVMQEMVIPLMLLQDYRKFNETVLHKTYAMYGDMAGMHTMCSVDRMASNGCTCFRQNVFSNDPAYVLQIQEHTPCFGSDVGLALPDCSQYHPDCASTVSQKKDVTDLAKLILAYMNLPSNCLVRVTDLAHRKQKKVSNVYYIVVDEGQLAALSSGDASAELEGNSFTDGSKLIMELEKPFFNPRFVPFEIGNKRYEVVFDKAREGAEDRPEGDEQGGEAVGSGLSEDAQSDA